MDLNQILSREPKRRRANEWGQDEETNQFDNQYHHSTSWCQPHYEHQHQHQHQVAPEGGALQPHYRPSGVPMMQNANLVHAPLAENTMNNCHFSVWGRYVYWPQNSGEATSGDSRWPSSSLITSANTWFPGHTPPTPYEPSQAHTSILPSPYQHPIPTIQIPQPTFTAQEWPNTPLRDTLPPSLPFNGAQPQEQQLPPGAPSTQPEGQQDLNTLVCFGMVPSIAARYEHRATAQSLPKSFVVVMESSIRFHAKDNPEVSGQVSSEHGQVIQGLLDETSLSLCISCVTDGFHTMEAQKASSGLSLFPCTLEITVYGPLELFDEIGTWFDDYQVFLQDPPECHHEVKYCNPHRLSSDDLSSCPLLSEIITQRSATLQLEIIAQQPDLLDGLSSHENLEEAPQPSVIKRELRRHQKQALTFMLQRERGWDFFGQGPNLWEIVDTDQGRFFLNRVSNASQSDEPPQCYGGIVADPMGLGKTLTMIALAATDLDIDDSYMDVDQGDHQDVSATLIVVPPPLIGTWEEQLFDHVVEGGLRCRRHHREGRLTSFTEIEQANIVLTTYHTISAEWKTSSKAACSILFSVRWRRIILDEAHLIRNSNSRMSQAICALESRSRWAVTGTPLQNRLGDLATLFKFVRAHPYTDRRCFDADISRLWKTGEYQEAIKRLKRLSKCLLLRRDKGTVSLPPRKDLQCPVDFRPEERTLYEKLRQRAIVSIDEALSRDSDSSKSGSYVNVLQQIESLRLVCNLGLHYSSRHTKASQDSQVDDWVNVAQSTFNMQRDMGPIVCSLCSSSPDITETLLEDSSTTPQNHSFFSCLAFVCADCAQGPRKNIGCGHNPSCTMAQVSTSGQALESSSLGMQPQTSKGLPSKVEALITNIKALPPHEKCIVFSTWRLTLDVVEAGLNKACVPCVRFDGKVPQKERQNNVDRFRNDPSIRVMLLTLSCGAAGLTLTVATRAYLMEPHWNPTLEEQALARIHRIGQTREVTTVRFFVRDSFEQQVIKVQESKKYLAGLLLSPHDNGQASENLGKLQELLSLI